MAISAEWQYHVFADLELVPARSSAQGVYWPILCSLAVDM